MNWRTKVADATTHGAARLLRLVGPSFSTHVAVGLYERFQRGHGSWDIRIHDPPKVEPNDEDAEIIERIFQAFQKSKKDQPQRDKAFLPSSMWQGQLDDAYSPLSSGDKFRFHAFLANFGSSDGYTGIEHSTIIRDCRTSASNRDRLQEYVVPRLLTEWTERESKGRSIDSIDLPMFGNLCGFKVGESEFSLNVFAYDVCSRMVTSALANRSQSRIAELGGGYGGWVPFLDRQVNGMTYLDFDLPETLCCASYYLMKVFPEKRFLLYGERDFDESCFDNFDFVLLPSFEITKLPPRSLDLFLNCASLSEMRPETAKTYLREICRTTDRFWHMNHENNRNEFADGSHSLLNHEYPLSDDFVLQSRHFFTWSVIYYLFPEGWDYHWYLYERQSEQIGEIERADT